MNTQEHIKNCKECGNGFYHQGLDVCQTCKVRRQDGYPAQWTNAERQAMAAQNHDPLKFNQIRSMQDSMNQGILGGKDHREAQRQVNMMYSDLANMVASKSKEELREIGRKAAHQGYIDGLFWYWVIRFALFCSACIFAFILYMHIFKL